MQIHQNDNSKKGRFYVQSADKILAEMTYVWAGNNRFIIDHTEVDDSLAGKGIGRQLVDKAVEFARAKGVTIIPLCPFAKSVFEKVNAFKDVL